MKRLSQQLDGLIRDRKPAVVHGEGHVGHPEWGFLLARSATERLLAGQEGTRLRLYSAGEELLPEQALLPQEKDGSLVGWLDRVKLPEPSLILNNVQCLDPEVWRWVRQLLGELFSEGMPAGGNSLEIFTGRYTQSAFGLHKDDQDVVTFVLKGTKIFYTWPFEVFAERSQNCSALSNYALPELNWREHLDRATRLEARPGDIVYWPADAWHIAAADDPDLLVTTFGLGFFRGGNPAQLFSEAIRTGILQGEVPQPAHLRPDQLCEGWTRCWRCSPAAASGSAPKSSCSPGSPATASPPCPSL